jgi:hypothetical protein
VLVVVEEVGDDELVEVEVEVELELGLLEELLEDVVDALAVIVKLVPSLVSAEGVARTLVPLFETIVMALFGNAAIEDVVVPIVAKSVFATEV